MKKTIKILALILAMCMLCVCLTGCNFIDEMRKNQGFLDESGNIVFSDGRKYVPISLPEELQINSGYEYTGNVTEKDVPVLLSDMFGKPYYMTADKIFIEMEISQSGLTSYYCKQDEVEYITDTLANGYEPTGYLYYYYDMEEEITKNYIFSKKEVETVNKVLESVKPTVFAEEYKIAWETVIDIYSHSEDAVFIRYEFGIGILEGKYKIVVDATTVYDVPEEYTVIFDNLIKKYLKYL